MTTSLLLESFDDVGQAGQALSEKPAAPATYEQGYAEGLAAADAANKADQSALQADLVRAIETASFGYHEAQSDMVAAVKPLLDRMMSTLLPEVLAPALHAHLRDIVEAALRTDLARPMRLAVSPDQITAVQATLADLDVAQLEVTTDPGLSAHAAWITTDSLETSLDLDAALSVIGDHIATLHTMIDQSQEVS